MIGGNLLEKLLEGQDDSTRNQVMQVVHQFGLRESDPLFLLMVANSTVQVLLRQAPNDLRQTFNDCFEKTRIEYAEYEKAALAGIKGDIAKTVEQLVAQSTAQANAAKNAITYRSLIGAGAMLLGVLTIGGLCGLGAARWLAQLDGRGLTASEVKSLDWAQSKEGLYAYNLMQWNPGLGDGQCQKQAQELGAIQIGNRTATSGYCFLWTVPPNQRQFKR